MRGHLIRKKNFNQVVKKYIDLSNYCSKLSVIDIDKDIKNFNYLNIKEYYPKTSNDTLIVLSEEDTRKVIIISSQTILLTTKNTDLFDKLVFPELLNLYVSNSGIEKFIEYKEKNAFILNNNFYILNFDNNFLDLHIDYLNNIKEKEDYKLFIRKDYQKEEKDITEEDYVNYSYGYINVLFIAVIISLLTVIICLINY